tara:strand:- start:460 stop:597 length:138 start_codon:yes stop_codon:yes gene_type:complete
LTEENIKISIDFLINEIQQKTGVSYKEIMELKQIMDLADFSHEED